MPERTDDRHGSPTWKWATLATERRMDGKTSEERAREAIEALPRGISDPLLLQIVHKHKILRAFHHFITAL